MTDTTEVTLDGEGDGESESEGGDLFLPLEGESTTYGQEDDPSSPQYGGSGSGSSSSGRRPFSTGQFSGPRVPKDTASSAGKGIDTSIPPPRPLTERYPARPLPPSPASLQHDLSGTTSPFENARQEYVTPFSSPPPGATGPQGEAPFAGHSYSTPTMGERAVPNSDASQASADVSSRSLSSSTSSSAASFNPILGSSSPISAAQRQQYASFFGGPETSPRSQRLQYGLGTAPSSTPAIGTDPLHALRVSISHGSGFYMPNNEPNQSGLRSINELDPSFPSSAFPSRAASPSTSLRLGYGRNDNNFSLPFGAPAEDAEIDGSGDDFGYRREEVSRWLSSNEDSGYHNEEAFGPGDKVGIGAQQNSTSGEERLEQRSARRLSRVEGLQNIQAPSPTRFLKQAHPFAFDAYDNLKTPAPSDYQIGHAYAQNCVSGAGGAQSSGLPSVGDGALVRRRGHQADPTVSWHPVPGRRKASSAMS